MEVKEARVKTAKITRKRHKKILKQAKGYYGAKHYRFRILCDSKVGLINAAAATTLAIEKYHPDYIINQSCAGGFGRDVHQSDIVVGTECINITSMSTKFRKEGEGCNLNDWELIKYIAGEKDRLVPQKAGQELVEAIKKIENEYFYGKIHYGVICSGVNLKNKD